MWIKSIGVNTFARHCITTPQMKAYGPSPFAFFIDNLYNIVSKRYQIKSEKIEQIKF